MGSKKLLGKLIYTGAIFSLILIPWSAAIAQQPGAVPMPITLPPIQSDRKVLTVLFDGKTVNFSLPKLEKIGLYRLKTSTFWKEDDGVYEGILLKDLLAQVGMEHTEEILVGALDGYSSVIKREDWSKWPVMLATRRDGKQMSIRNKGPTRIIYPRDMDAELSQSERRTHWVWAVKTIQPKLK